MKTIFTRFKNKQVFDTLIYSFKDENGDIVLPNIDVIGDIYSEPVVDEDGEVVSPPVKEEGYHVNFACTIPDVFKPYIIPRPSTPERIFAGDEGLGE